MRRRTLLIALAFLACSQRGGRRAPAAEARGRFVLLGFDGVDPRLFERLRAEGKLPHLDALARAGGYAHLRSTNPPQSPVAWTSFATGTPPSDHGIFDFVRRDVATYLPAVGTTRLDFPGAGPPRARNLRHGQPFWQTADAAGVRAFAFNVPYSFPPDPLAHGRMLSGLGVPDLRGTNSMFTFFSEGLTEAQARRPVGGGEMVALRMENGVALAALKGTPRGGRNQTAPIELRPAGHDAVALYVGGRDVRLAVGQMSGWIEADFDGTGAPAARGIFRALALSARPLKVYVSPINLHPRAPLFGFTSPTAFAAELADRYGLYKTVGWDHDTSALNAEVIDEDAFLRDVNETESQKVQMVLDRLRENRDELFIAVFTATDRVAHMFYRLIDPRHPRYDAALAARHGNAIEAAYRTMDEVVGRARALLGPRDTLLVISDHGFHSYRRGLHVNAWLRANGWLAVRPDTPARERDFLQGIDWSNTRAYAVGTGQIYLNLRGREGQGIVEPQEREALGRRIAQALETIDDRGVRPVRRAYTREQAFRGAFDADAPDLQIAFSEGYRTSWETILGGVPETIFADNNRKWSGDHAASDVDDTPGIVVSNRALATAEPSILDLAPTALAHFGIAPPAPTPGRNLLR